MDELTIGDKIYISSKQAAKITGYAKDYVGQLCREGRVAARLVGRNWYVLESSIREHRFGPESKARAATLEPVEEITPSPVSSWEAPKYAPVESEVLMPTLEPQKRSESAPKTAEAVALMQDAWKEWFETRERIAAPAVEQIEEAQSAPVREPEEQQEVGTDEVRVSDMANVYAVEKVSHDEEGSAVPLARIDHATYEEEMYEPEHPSQEEPVQMIRRDVRMSRGVIDLSRAQEETYEPTPVRERRTTPHQRAPRARGSLALQALLLSVAGLAIATAVIGSGAFDTATGGSLRGFIFDALQGESRVDK